MIKSATLDPSKRLDLYFRINRVGSLTFTFLDSDGNAYSIDDIYTDYDFTLQIKNYPGARTNRINLDIGNGLEIISPNKLMATVTAAQTNIDQGEYYWELFLDAQTKTWLCGKAIFHNGEFDGVESSTGITIDNDGTDVQITIDVGGLAEWGEITGTLSDQADLQSELDAKLDAAALDTGGVTVTFDIPRTYGHTTALTGNITIDETGAVKGMTQLVIHNDSSEPTYGIGTTVIAGTYETGVDNYIFYNFVKPGLILVSISQAL